MCSDRFKLGFLPSKHHSCEQWTTSFWFLNHIIQHLMDLFVNSVGVKNFKFWILNKALKIYLSNYFNFLEHPIKGLLPFLKYLFLKTRHFSPVYLILGLKATTHHYSPSHHTYILQKVNFNILGISAKC